MPLGPHALAHLQGRAGNRAVAQLLVGNDGAQSGSSCDSRSVDDSDRAEAAVTESGTDLPAIAVQRSQLDEFAGGCGVCLDPITAGIRAHDIVSAEFRRSGSFKLTDIPITAPVAGDDTPSPFTPRPDFVSLSPTSIQIGELKPPLSSAAGREQLRKYASRIRAQFPNMRVGFLNNPVTKPLTYPNPESPQCPTQEIRVASGGRGLSIYGCVPTRNELRAANPDSCGCGGKKKKEPQDQKVPNPPPLPSPDVLRLMIEVLEEIFKRQPRLVPQPAQPPLFIPKFRDCPFDDPIQRQLFCIDPEGPVASFCAPLDEAALLGFGQPPIVGAASGAGGSGGSPPDALGATPDTDPAEFEGLRRGDGVSPGTADRQSRVKRLQERLNDLGGELEDDGKFGAKTAEFLHLFQQRNGLAESDAVDRPTSLLLAEAPDGAAVSRFDGLRRGDGLTPETVNRRPRVRELQTRLSAYQFPCEVDGKFGSQTTDSLNGFQRSKQIEPSEVVTPPTADALEGRGSIGGTCMPGSVLTIVLPPELSPTTLLT